MSDKTPEMDSLFARMALRPEIPPDAAAALRARARRSSAPAGTSSSSSSALSKHSVLMPHTEEVLQLASISEDSTALDNEGEETLARKMFDRRARLPHEETSSNGPTPSHSLAPSGAPELMLGFENRVLSRAALLECMNEVYEAHGVVYDDEAVGKWIDASLRSLNLSLVDPQIKWSDFLVFYRCGVAFADSKRRQLSAVVAKPRHRRMVSRDCTAYERHVFLGGSCNPTTWRRDVAIPILEKARRGYFNPQTDNWFPELIEIEASAKDECHVLLFVIDCQTRSIASMLEAVEYIMRGRRVVLVVENIPDGLYIDGQEVTGRQLKDLNRARGFLTDIVVRHPDNAVVFDSVSEACHYIADMQCTACDETLLDGPLGLDSISTTSRPSSGALSDTES